MKNSESHNPRKTCPHCDRVLMDTVGLNCGWCGQELPEELRPSRTTIDAVFSEEKKQSKRARELDAISEKVRRNIRNTW